MILDHDWTKVFHGVSHLMRNGIQYTINNHGSFIHLQKYSWWIHEIIEDIYFFVEKFDENIHINEKNRYWNCRNIENAIKWARYYAKIDGSYQMYLNKNNLEKFEYFLEE